jgi:hypothetical protein
VATLGIVELFVFLLLKYYDGVDKERKSVFADVHFALFYTAIFNALQSVLLAFVTTKASARLWVRTEHLELDHYVEIREEFDRVQGQLFDHNDKHTIGRGKLLYASMRGLRSPALRSRRDELLVQVRFHELRLHFLEGNDLPLTLKVSDYLKRSEQRVLTQLVHVSGSAWLMLTGGLNLVYYLMGMVAYATGDGELIGTSLTYIFFTSLFVYICVVVALYWKMRRIFQAIL